MTGDNETNRHIQVPDWFAAPQNHFWDIASVVRTVHTAVSEAEAQAASLSIAANYGFHLNIANLANEALLQMQERDLPLPVSVIAHEGLFQKYGREAQSIPGMCENGVIILNPGANIWNAPIVSAFLLHKARFWSTPHPLHAFFHEAGHLLQFSGQKRQRPLTPKQASMAASISDYALVNADELVAEMFAGLMAGVRYDPDMLTVYRRLGGRVP